MGKKNKKQNPSPLPKNKNSQQAVVWLCSRVAKSQMLAWPCPKQKSKLPFCCLHGWEGHTVPSALRHWGERHRSREWIDKSQCWPCLQWPLSGQQCIKSTSPLNSFCFRPTNCWLSEANESPVIQNRGDTLWPSRLHSAFTFLFSQRVASQQYQLICRKESRKENDRFWIPSKFSVA